MDKDVTAHTYPVSYSAMRLTVCSDKLTRTSVLPEALAKARTRLVLPTPGEPSSRMGLLSFVALKSRWAFMAVVPALNA